MRRPRRARSPRGLAPHGLLALTPQPGPVLRGCPPEAGLEVAVEVALVGEARGGGGGGNGFPGFEQAAGGADAVRDLQRVWRQAGALAHEPDEPELADA